MFRHHPDGSAARRSELQSARPGDGAPLGGRPDPDLTGMVGRGEGSPKRRGRPRAFDPEAALQRALETFWKGGYVGTSLDDLSAAMGINRPSIYAAFGDKRALYVQAIDLYRELQRCTVEKALAEDRSLEQGLRALARTALASYVAGAFGPRGCFMAGIAVTEAPSDPEVRRALETSIRDLEKMLAARFQRARQGDDVALPGPPELLAHMACDILHGLALRARAGVARDELERSADAAMALLCGRRGSHTA